MTSKDLENVTCKQVNVLNRNKQLLMIKLNFLIHVSLFNYRATSHFIHTHLS